VEHSQSQLRLLGPASYLPKEEFEFIWAPSVKAILSLSTLPDIVIFHRNYYRLTEMKKIIKFCRKRDIPTVMEFDDYVLEVPTAYASHNYYESIKDDLKAIFKQVDALIVTNERIKEAYRRYNPNIFLLPNLIDEKIWKKPVLQKKGVDDKIIIGYAGAQSHAYDFENVISAIQYILSKYKDRIILRFIGYQPIEFSNLPNFEHIPMINSYKKYASALLNSDFSFALAPLKKDIVTKYKSNIKYLEYSACGYPGIYSAVEPYADSIKNKETGLLVSNSSEDWIAAMEEMIKDATLRKTIAQNAYNDVRQNYSMNSGAVQCKNVLEQIAHSRTNKKRYSLVPLFSYGPYMLYAALRKMLGL